MISASLEMHLHKVHVGTGGGGDTSQLVWRDKKKDERRSAHKI